MLVLCTLSLQLCIFEIMFVF